MIDQLITLSRPAWLPCTQQFDVSLWIEGDDLVRLNLETAPPQLVFEDRQKSDLDGSVSVRSATDAELAVILAGLQEKPPRPNAIAPLEILQTFTESEQDAIESHARRLARMLFSATDVVAWPTFSTACRDLLIAGILTPERFTEITGESS